MSKKKYKELSLEEIEYLKHVYYLKATHKEKTDISFCVLPDAWRWCKCTKKATDIPCRFAV